MSKMVILQQQILLRSRQPKHTTRKSRLMQTVVPALPRRRTCHSRTPIRTLSFTSHTPRPQDQDMFSADGRSTGQRDRSIRQGQKSPYTDITIRPDPRTRYTRIGRRTHPAVCGYTRINGVEGFCGYIQIGGIEVFHGYTQTELGNEVDKTWNRQCRQCARRLTCWIR